MDSTKKDLRLRLLYIDNLRILLITLVILLHLAVIYGGPGDFYYQEMSTGDAGLLAGFVFGLFNMTVMGFTMGFFFLVSGYFTPGSYDRKSGKRFLTDRLLRLGIPFIFYVIIIDPIIDYTILRVATGSVVSFPQFLGSYIDNYKGIGSGPMWFVSALLIFNIFYLFWRKLNKFFGCTFHSKDRAPRNASIALFAIIMGIVTFIVRIWLPVGWEWIALNFQIPFFTQYISMYIMGLIAYHGHWFERLTSAQGIFWLVHTMILIILCPVILFLGGAAEDYEVFMGGASWQSLFYSVWEQFICVGMVAGLSVLFRWALNHQGTLMKALSASAYTVYIIHPAVIVFLALALKGISIYPLLKFALVAPLAVGLCFILATGIRKLPLAREIL